MLYIVDIAYNNNKSGVFINMIYFALLAFDFGFGRRTKRVFRCFLSLNRVVFTFYVILKSL